MTTSDNINDFIYKGKILVALTQMLEDGSVYDENLLLSLFQSIDDDFLLCKILELIASQKIINLVQFATKYLSHPNPRVRANATEAVSLDIKSSLSKVFELAEDNNNRVAVNAILALKKQPTKKLHELINNLTYKTRSDYCFSLLYLIDHLSNINRIDLLNKLLYTHNPHVRDLVYSKLKKLENNGNQNAVIIRKNVDAQILLHQNRKNFFRNSLDDIMSSFIDRFQETDFCREEITRSKDPFVEREAIKKILDKVSIADIADLETLENIKYIDSDAEFLKNLLSASKRTFSDTDTFNKVLIRIVEQELAILEQRKNFAITCSVYDLLKPDIENNEITLIQPDLAYLKAIVWSYVPEEEFSVLPGRELSVIDIFTLTMNLYQKHIWDFTLITFHYIIKALAWIGAICATFYIVHEYILLFIIPVILIFVTAFKCLKLFIAWQISIILMLQDFVHGRQYNHKEISASVSETLKTVYYVAQEKYKRLFLYGVGFTLLAKILAIPIPALSIETIMYSFMNWLVNISFIVLTSWQTFKLLLVEPIAVIAPKFDAFRTSFEFFNENKTKLIMLFLIGTFLSNAVAATSGQIMDFMPFGKYQIILKIALIILSSLFLSPIILSNMTIYCLIKLKNYDIKN
ncbi:MAG: hypothetical protein PHC34_13895 [Candidatus Gastranaerophilales bacterium]|nr:hypothetical protein [Candidatus Gastranaerophilales bacterium]